jgi:uncharacterized damage-inducible protein DinB
VPNAFESIRYYTNVRSRTDRLVPLISPAIIEWRPAPDAFSPGDLLRHLAGTERYMWAENAQGHPARYPGHAFELAPGYDETLRYFEGLRKESLDVFRSLTDEDLERKVGTPAGASMPLWKWLRAMVEHESHHRGQLYLLLRLKGIATPPLFGLTSEQVRAAGEPHA